MKTKKNIETGSCGHKFKRPEGYKKPECLECLPCCDDMAQMGYCSDVCQCMKCLTTLPPVPEPEQWRVMSTGNHQGLVVDERSSKNIAVTYDKADAPLIAAAPDLLTLLERGLECGVFDDAPVFKRDVEQVIRKAKGA